MIKKITFVVLVCCILVSCGKKGDPEYKVLNKEIKMTAEMLNLLGCNKDNFKKLLKSMEYKITEKNNEIYFKYYPKRDFKKPNKKMVKESPFGILKNLDLN